MICSVMQISLKMMEF